MKRYVDELVKRINELIKVYENYLWQDENRYLVIGFQDRMIGFHLYDGYDIVDMLYLSFGEKEEKIYQAVSLKTFAIVLGNVKVYESVGPTFSIYHNDALKPYLAVASADNNMTALLDLLIDNQETQAINSSPIIEAADKKVKRYLPNASVLKEIDKRIDLSKDIVRGKL